MAGAGGMPWPEVRADNIDTLSDSFPPCMRQLHHKLRTQHRLRHSARVGISIGTAASEGCHQFHCITLVDAFQERAERLYDICLTLYML